MAEKIRDTIEEHSFRIVDRKTCSFGIAMFDLQEDDYKEVMKRSDEALYRAKKNGRNCVINYHQSDF